jgi:hypothetical protein
MLVYFFRYETKPFTSVAISQSNILKLSSYMIRGNLSIAQAVEALRVARV